MPFSARPVDVTAPLPRVVVIEVLCDGCRQDGARFECWWFPSFHAEMMRRGWSYQPGRPSGDWLCPKCSGKGNQKQKQGDLFK